MVSGPSKLAWGASLLLAASGCLLTVDFDEYGSGGGDAVTTSSTTASSATTATGAGGSGGAADGGGGAAEELAVCEADGARYYVLPEAWDDVHVAPSGTGFVAAPESDLVYVSFSEGAPPTVHERADTSKPLLGVFTLLGASGAIRPYAAVPGGDGTLVASFSGDPPSAAGNGFGGVHQSSAFTASLLNVFGQLGAIRYAGIYGFARPESDLIAFPLIGPLGDILASAQGGDARFDAHAVVLDDQLAPQFAAIAGTAPSAARVQDTDIPAGAFLVYLTAGDAGLTGPALPLGDLLVESQDVEVSLNADGFWVAGQGSDGQNALIEAGLSVVTSRGAQVLGWPSRLAPGRWLVNATEAGANEVEVYETEDPAAPLLIVGGALGFDIASVRRDAVAGRVGTLVSIVVGDADVPGACPLPAGRRVLVELDRDPPP